MRGTESRVQPLTATSDAVEPVAKMPLQQIKFVVAYFNDIATLGGLLWAESYHRTICCDSGNPEFASGRPSMSSEKADQRTADNSCEPSDAWCPSVFITLGLVFDVWPSHRIFEGCGRRCLLPAMSERRAKFVVNTSQQLIGD